MKVTQKARAALGEHQSKSIEMAFGDAGAAGIRINCTCGMWMEIPYHPNDANAAVVLYGRLSEHQIEMMEAA